MLELTGEWSVNDGAYQQVLGYFRALGLLDAIVSDTGATLALTTSHGGRQGETHLLVGGVDVEATVHVAWCTEGVQQRPARIVIDVTDGCKSALALELLAHEWCLHGTKDWRFIEAMRTAQSRDAVLELSVDILGTAKAAIDVPEHRELAEGTHELFRQTMLQLKNAHPDLADGLLAAWEADISDYQAAARAGHVWQPSWDALPPATAVQPGSSSADFDMTTEEKSALEDFLGPDFL